MLFRVRAASTSATQRIARLRSVGASATLRQHDGDDGQQMSAFYSNMRLPMGLPNPVADQRGSSGRRRNPSRNPTPRDRSVIITLVTFAAAAAAFGALWATEVDFLLTVVLFGLFGGFSLPLYSLCLAHANDYLEHDQMVSASAGLVMISGLGACVGPLSVAVAMSSVGPQGFYWYLALVHGLIGLFALYRMSRRPSLPRAEQGPYVAIAPRSSSWAATAGPSEVREQLEREAEADAATAPEAPAGAAFSRES